MNNSEGQTQEPVGGMMAIVKEICSDFMFENSNRISGYKAVRKLFDDWFSNNPYWQNKLSSPPPSPVGIDVEAMAKEHACNVIEMGWRVNPNKEDILTDFKTGYAAALLQLKPKDSASLPQSSTEEECQHPFREVRVKGPNFFCDKCKHSKI